MSNFLITITVPFVCNIGPFVSSGSSSFLRLCDGPTDLTLNSVTYYSYYWKSISEFGHEVNLLSGGNIESVTDFSLDIVDNSILETIEMGGNSLNSGTLQLSKLDDDGITIENLWFGYLNGTEIKENILTLTCSTVEKGLGSISTPEAFGVCSKMALSIDSSISVQKLEFLTAAGTTSYHPKIIKTISTQNPNDNNYGVARVNQTSGTVAIVISHYNDIFANNGATSGTLVTPITGSAYYTKYRNLLVKFATGDSANTETSYRVDSITRIVDGLYSQFIPAVNMPYQTKLILKEDVFGSIDIKAFDRITVTEGVSYYLIESDMTEDDIYQVSVKDSDAYYGINGESWGIETINHKKYIAVYSRSDVYSEVPISLSLNYHQWSTDGGYSTTTLTPITYKVDGTTYTTSLDLSNITDTDLSNYVGIDAHTMYRATGSDYTLYDDLYFKMIPNLSSYAGKTLYFGALIDRPSLDRDSISYNVNTYLESGEVYPCQGDGSVSYSAFKSYVASLHTGLQGYINSVPLNGISYPDNMVGSYTPQASTVAPNTWINGLQQDLSGQYYHAITSPSTFWAFDSSQLFEIPVDSGVYDDISYIMFTLRGTATNNSQGSANPPEDLFCTYIYKIGIWAKVTIDSADTVYIDVKGRIGTGKPDSVIKDIIEDYDNSVSTSFDSLMGGVVYDSDSTVSHKSSLHHYIADKSTKATDAIATISKGSSLVVGQDAGGTFYSRKISLSNNTVEVAIPSSDIYNIKEALKDIDISNVINMPKITFYDLDETEQTIEVIDLTATFPTLANFLIDTSLINSVFSLSEDFIEKAITYSSLTDLYNLFLYPLHNYCLTSYIKNGVGNMCRKTTSNEGGETGEIIISNIYLEYLLRTDNNSTGTKTAKTTTNFNGNLLSGIYTDGLNYYGCINGGYVYKNGTAITAIQRAWIGLVYSIDFGTLIGALSTGEIYSISLTGTETLLWSSGYALKDISIKREDTGFVFSGVHYYDRFTLSCTNYNCLVTNKPAIGLSEGSLILSSRNWITSDIVYGTYLGFVDPGKHGYGLGYGVYGAADDGYIYYGGTNSDTKLTTVSHNWTKIRYYDFLGCLIGIEGDNIYKIDISNGNITLLDNSSVVYWTSLYIDNDSGIIYGSSDYIYDITNIAEIDTKTVYYGYADVLSIVQQCAQLRKTLTVELPISYKNTALGSRVTVYDPRLMQNHTIYGHATGVKIDPSTNRTQITLLCDSYTDGGNIDFF